jgi:hypothetical protein
MTLLDVMKKPSQMLRHYGLFNLERAARKLLTSALKPVLNSKFAVYDYIIRSFREEKEKLSRYISTAGTTSMPQAMMVR